VAAETDAEYAATKAQCDHDTDHYVSVSVHRSTPPGEHVSSF
jgi:hypothetical protein